ncbi:MAG: cytochrome c3 family protein [bacterium]
MKPINSIPRGLKAASFVVIVLLSLVPAAQAQEPAHPHDRLACTQCHFRGGRVAAAGMDGGVSPAGVRDDRRTDRCSTCHKDDPEGLAATLGFHRPGSDNCARCHSFHEAGKTTGPGSGVDLTTAKRVDASHCRSCHAPGADLQALSAGHRRAAELYHEDTGTLIGKTLSEGCLLCHDADGTSPWLAATAKGISTVSEHTSHPRGVLVRPGTGTAARHIRKDLDARAPLFGGRIECQTCHLLTAGSEDLLIPFASRYDLCLACHQTAGPDSPGQEKVLANMIGKPGP